MTLINCPDCSRDVSNRAPACIHCGCPLTAEDASNGLTVVEQKPLVEPKPRSTWIIGSDWTLPDDGNEQRVYCMDCDRDVYFPRGQENHSTHTVKPLVWSPKGWHDDPLAIEPTPTPAQADSKVRSPGSIPDVGSQVVRDRIQAECDQLMPDDPVGAAKAAHEKRLELAADLRMADSYTPEQYLEFRTASVAELERTVRQRKMNPWVKQPTKPWDWSRIANFRSRTRRVELLVAMAVAWLTVIAAAIVDGLLWDYPVFTILSLGVWLWLYVGASVNRFHDMGYIGWTVLWAVVPFASFVILILALFVRGDSQPNRWGPPVA